MRDAPAAAAELRALVDELTPASAASAPGTVHDTISGGVQWHGTVIQVCTAHADFEEKLKDATGKGGCATVRPREPRCLNGSAPHRS
jgi:hypothetical protein